MTIDVAATIGLFDDEDLHHRLEQYPDQPRAELEALRDGGVDGYRGLANGLSESENRELATTPRAGRVAALTALGLARLQQLREDPTHE